MNITPCKIGSFKATRLLLLLWLALAQFGVEVQAQRSFTNLDFEASTIPNGTQAGSVFGIGVMRGWGANGFATRSGASGIPPVIYDGYAPNGGSFSINDAGAGDGISPMQGKYSAEMTSGGSAGWGITMFQTGLVPIGTKSLLIEETYSRFPMEVDLSPNPGPEFIPGPLTLVPLQTMPAFTLYGADVSAYAGTSATLTLSDQPTFDSTVNIVKFDNIVFSPNAIPEPGTWAMVLCGVGLLVGARRFRWRNGSQDE